MKLSDSQLTIKENIFVSRIYCLGYSFNPSAFLICNACTTTITTECNLHILGIDKFLKQTVLLHIQKSKWNWTLWNVDIQTCNPSFSAFILAGQCQPCSFSKATCPKRKDPRLSDKLKLRELKLTRGKIRSLGQETLVYPPTRTIFLNQISYISCQCETVRTMILSETKVKFNDCYCRVCN